MARRNRSASRLGAAGTSLLEGWEVVRVAPGAGEAVLGLRRPVVAPLHDTRQAGNVIVALAPGFGGSTSAPVPWQGYTGRYDEGQLQGLAH